MKKYVVCLMLALFAIMTSGCGSSDDQSRYAGEYVSSSWHDDAVAHFQIKSDGELSGYLLVMSGFLYEMTGSISPAGSFTVSIRDPSTHQPVPNTATSGTSDGADILTGTAYASPNETYQYVLTRVNPNSNRYYGIFNCSLTGTNFTGECQFGIDFNGNIYGYATGTGWMSEIYLTGNVDKSNGNITITNSYAIQDAVTMTGTIGADGSIANGTWQDSTFSGSFAGVKLPMF